MTNSVAGDLHTINRAIGDAEAAADHDFFEQLLAPAFSMGRPDGVRFADRAGFLDSLTVSSGRETRIDSTTIFDNRAIVVCLVSKADEAGPVRHRNIRVFTRPTTHAPWQLVSWVNESLTPSGVPPATG